MGAIHPTKCIEHQEQGTSHQIFGVEFQVLSVPILVDDDQWEPDEEFFIKISLTENKENSGVAKIGKKHIMTIRLVGLG